MCYTSKNEIRKGSAGDDLRCCRFYVGGEMSGLNDRQRIFVEEYLIDRNATQAAIRAGYSQKTAYSIGQRLLKKVEIQEAIKKRTEARIRRTDITADFVLTEIMKVASADASDFVKVGKRNRVQIIPTEEIPKDKLAALSGVKRGKNGELEVKLYDKLRALEMLGKHLGLFDKSQKDEADQAALAEFLKAASPTEEDIMALYDEEE